MLELLSSKKLSANTKKGIRQIGLAFGLTVFIFFLVLFVESVFKVDTINETKINKVQQNNAATETKHKDNDNKCEYITLICMIGDSKLLGQVQNFAVIAAAWLYFFDVFDRKKQVERQAWQMIDGAQGSETSGARYQAITDLYEEDKNSLKGLDADGADLIGINLQGANLERANFKDADLRQANLQNAKLNMAQFQKADLRGANLSGANLWGANLEGANLDRLKIDFENEQIEERECITNTNLKKATLSQAILNHAILNYADFAGAELKGAFLRCAHLANTNLQYANIFGAKFQGEIGLKINQVTEAYNWKDAKYDPKFCSENKQYNLQEDKGEDEVESSSSKVTKMFCKLVSILENNFPTKQKEIAEIQKKLTDIIQKIKSGNLENILEDLEDSLKLLNDLENSSYESNLERPGDFSQQRTILIKRASEFQEISEEAKKLIIEDEQEFGQADEILRKDEKQFRVTDEILRKDETKDA